MLLEPAEPLSDSVELSSQIPFFDADHDACFTWLRRKYAKVPLVVTSSSPDHEQHEGEAAQLTKADQLQLENDVAACETLRWSPFSFSSHPSRPLTSNAGAASSSHTTGKTSTTLAYHQCHPHGLRIDVGNQKKVSLDCCRPPEPWRDAPRFFESVISARIAQQRENTEDEDLLQRNSWVPKTLRPKLGGSITPVGRDGSARFLIFPQQHHITPLSSIPGAAAVMPFSRPSSKDPSPTQEVGSWVRGTGTWNTEEHNPAAAHTSAAPSQRLHGLHTSLVYAQKMQVKRTSAGEVPSWRSRWSPDVIEVHLLGQQQRTERQYAPQKKKVERVQLMEDAIGLTFGRGDPRRTTMMQASLTTAQRTGKHWRTSGKSGATPTTDDTVTRITVSDQFDSGGGQHFALPSWWSRLLNEEDVMGRYRLWWKGGPGIEVWRGGDTSSCTSPLSIISIYGKLWAESLVELPLPWRLQLKLRSQSSVVMPWDPTMLITASHIAGTSKSETNREDPANGVVEGESVEKSPPVGGKKIGVQPYFWATQGPRWDARLLRGFANDYNGLHHAKRWYTILSAELALRKGDEKPRAVYNPAELPDSGEAPDGKNGRRNRSKNTQKQAWQSQWWKKTEMNAFANACFVDSLTAYPRASVGFSLVSDIPRLTITAFNEAIPTRFECSFSWFAAFKEDGGIQLQSGMQPNMPADRQYMRISPVETFHHMKCGLTWKF